jgi:C-terminal processing protease CtpA/Prc
MQVRRPGAEPRQLDLAARVEARHALIDPGSSIDLWQFLRDQARSREENAARWLEVGQQAVILRLPGFFGDGDWVDKYARDLRDHDTAIIDLRGNPGGAVDLLTRFLGLFYETDLAVARVVERKKTTDLRVKGRGRQRYPGQVIVLVDAGSASASELFARTLQLTGRGMVLGDRSAGAVRVSRFFGHASGTQTAAFYGASVTIADVVMSDGARLEGAGVVPDELILPSGEQMGRREDPVLARALALAGVDWTPERAGRSW